MDTSMQFPEDAPRAYAPEELEQHLRALAQTAVSLARDIDCDSMLAYALRASAVGCHASRAILMTLDSRDHSLQGVVPALNISDADALALRIGARECSAADAAIKRGISTVGSRIGNHAGLPAIATAVGARSCLIAPINAGKDAVGLICLFDKDPAYGGFSALDVAFVRTTAGLLGGALHGMRVRDHAPTSIVGNVSGLVGQAHFDETVSLEMERAERLGHALACAALEIVNFPQLVEAHGPQSADVVIRHLGQTLAKHVRQIDVLVRYDDERIVLLMPGTPAETARVVVQRLNAHLMRISWPKVGKVELRCGVTSYPHEAKSAHELVATALKRASADADRGSGAA
jgi:diguanylate cyclase (GGDEF)-like protein